MDINVTGTKYLVVCRDEGCPRIEFMTKEKVECMLSNEWLNHNFAFRLPSNDIANFPIMTVFIFKGEVIFPRTTQTVKWEVD